MLIHEFEGGTIEYRLPNIPESLRLLQAMGIKATDLESGELENELEIMAALLEKMDKFIVKLNVEGIENYDEMLKDMKYMTPLSEMAGKIMEAFTVDDKKKESLPKP